MTDLHARLKAVVEERMAVAQAAISHTGRWHWDHGFGEMCNDADCPFGSLVDEAEPAEPTQGTVLMQVHGYDVNDEWQGAAHIALNDPADAILAAEHALGVLERHAPTREIVEWWDSSDGSGEAAVCGRCVNREPNEWDLGRGNYGQKPDGWVSSYVLSPCDEIRALATRYGTDPE